MNDYMIEDTSVRSADAGIFMWQLSDDTVYADAALADLFGLDSREAERGLPIVRFLDRIREDDRPDVAKAIHEAIVTGEAYQRDYRIVRPDATEVGVSAFGRCFRDANGTPSHYAGIVYPSIGQPMPSERLFWHCLQAHDLARQCGEMEMVELLGQALRRYGRRSEQDTSIH